MQLKYYNLMKNEFYWLYFCKGNFDLIMEKNNHGKKKRKFLTYDIIL